MQTSNSSIVEPREALLDHTRILYDAALVSRPQILSFEPRELIERRALVGETGGRGRTYFIRIEGNDWVLRHYRRGGAIAPLLKDRYLWMGLERSRAWLEWHLLRELWLQGLPVPRPVAARVSRTALIYTADLITQRLVGACSLADKLKENALTQEQWQAIGSCIRRFHEVGVNHGDLNAHNILLAQRDHVYLVDFDKSTVHRFTPSTEHQNLARLRRSLHKLQSLFVDFHFSDSAWQALCVGYDAGPHAR